MPSAAAHPVKGNPEKLILNQGQSKLYVAVANADELVIIDTASNAIVSEVQGATGHALNILNDGPAIASSRPVFEASAGHTVPALGFSEENGDGIGLGKVICDRIVLAIQAAESKREHREHTTEQ